MNSLQRVVAAVKFNPPDRVPVIAQVFAHAGTLAGVAVDQYVRSGDTVARCQLAALKSYGYDAVFAAMDSAMESEAVGSLLRYGPNRYPVIEKYALASDSDFTALSIPDPRRAGRMPEMLKALQILRGELADEVLVVGCVLGPFTLAGQLIGLEKALYLAVDQPERFERLLDFAAEVVIRFGRSQIEAGAHLPLLFDPAASPAVIPPAFFREFELPRLKRINQEFKAAGALINWLHIAGPAAPILGYYPAAAVDIANFDYNITISEARNQLPLTCLDGNLKSLSFVEAGPADISRESMNLLNSFRDRGGFILSSGCEIPPESNPENVMALVRAVQR